MEKSDTIGVSLTHAQRHFVLGGLVLLRLNVTYPSSNSIIPRKLSSSAISYSLYSSVIPTMTLLSKPLSDKDEANPGHEKKRVFTDTSARFHVKDTTIILQASETPFVVDSAFDTTSDAVLVYAETIKIDSKLIQLPGKNLGLFCNKLLITQDTEIDVSGIDGKEGIPKTSGPKKDVPDDNKKKGDEKDDAKKDNNKDGDKGKDEVDNDATDGSDAGNVWLFIQDANVETLEKLRISAFGGRGGKGADSSAEGVSGNDGKAGGNGGRSLGSSLNQSTETILTLC